VRDDLIADSKGKTNGGRQPNDTTDPTQSIPMLQLQGQLQANQAEITNREQSISGLKGRINDYQARLNEEPTVEQQLADLTRGYDQTKTDYDELLKKKNASVMATSMEQMQQGERFTMLDPPSLPLKPDFPDRLKFCGIGLGVGFALGLVVAGGLEFMDDRLHSEEQIKSLLPVAILCEIPMISSPSDELNRNRRAVLGWATAALVIVTILAGSAFSYLRG
jgi:succinoglycan biosynthesis transport protein ExoP